MINRKSRIHFDKMTWLIIGVVSLLVILTLMVMWSDLMKGGSTNAIETIMNLLRTTPDD